MAFQKLTSFLLPLFRKSNTPQTYSALSEEESFLPSSSSLTEKEIAHNRDLHVISTFKYSLPWAFCTIFFASLSLVFWLQLPSTSGAGSFEKGFATDLADVRSSIEIEHVWFTGSPGFGKDGHEYVPERPASEPRYVGTPGPEVDEAWDQLTSGRYIVLTDDEAREAWGPGYQEFWHERADGYVAGLDMMHSLHCLDHIRQAFYPEYYPQIPIHGTIHRDHCIDHLRQMVQCYGDATPIPTKYYEGIDQNYINSDRPHTCRSFSKLREWNTERFNGSTAVKLYNGH